MRGWKKNCYICFAALFLPIQVLAISNYDITLPSYPPGGVLYGPAGLNDLNQVVGPNWNVSSPIAYLWAENEYNELPIPDYGDPGNFAHDINNSGHYTGSESTAKPGVLWNGTQLVSLGTLGGVNSIPFALNESDHVAGRSLTSTINETAPFLWHNHSMINLGTLGGTRGSAYDINNQGVVVGYSENADGNCRAFIYQDGSMTDLGTLGGTQSNAVAINDANEIAGFSELVNGYQHACLWQNGQITDLGTLGGNQSQAFDINNAGQIFGWAETETGYRPLVVWENGQIIRLNSLIAPDSGWELIMNNLFHFDEKPFYKINNDGVIMGEGFVNGGHFTFLMIPREEDFLIHDSNHDGTVNMMDYVKFSEEWLK